MREGAELELAAALGMQSSAEPAISNEVVQ
jgi:hypothetical protein